MKVLNFIKLAKLFAVFYFIPLLLIFSVQAEDKTIYWTRWDSPPIYIFDGPYKNQGFQDKVEMAIRRELKNYQHKNIKANIQRIIKLAENKSNTCNAGWLDTPEWRKVFYFSSPTIITPSNGILIKKTHLDELRQIQPLSIQKVLEQKDWRLGVGKMFGEGIDEIIKKNEIAYSKKISKVSSPIQTHQMLQADRIDYTIGYPVEAFYYQKLLKAKDTILYVPVIDNKPFVEVVIACSRTPWGEKVIKEIDKIIKDIKIHKEFDSYQDRWQAPEVNERLKGPRREFYKKLKIL